MIRHMNTQPNPTHIRATSAWPIAAAVACLLIHARGVAQPADSLPSRSRPGTPDTSVIGVSRADDPEPMIGIEAMTGPERGGRIYAGLNLKGAQIPFFTTASVYDPRSGTTRVSSNAIFSGLGMLGFVPGHCSRSPLAGLALLGLPQWLTNMTIHVPVVGRTLYVDIAQRTDFYFFSTPSRIYTEAWVGLHGRIGPVGAALRYTWPLSRGYRESKGPYIGLNVYAVLKLS